MQYYAVSQNKPLLLLVKHWLNLIFFTHLTLILKLHYLVKLGIS